MKIHLYQSGKKNLMSNASKHTLPPQRIPLGGMSTANCVILKLPESGWSADWMMY